MKKDARALKARADVAYADAKTTVESMPRTELVRVNRRPPVVYRNADSECPRVAVASRCGGVGTTTIVANLAVCLAARGVKVLVVATETRAGYFDLTDLLGPSQVGAVRRMPGGGSLSALSNDGVPPLMYDGDTGVLLAGHRRLAAAEAVDIAPSHRTAPVKDVPREDYDLVLIDVSGLGGRGGDADAGWDLVEAADLVIVPVPLVQDDFVEVREVLAGEDDDDGAAGSTAEQLAYVNAMADEDDAGWDDEDDEEYVRVLGQPFEASTVIRSIVYGRYLAGLRPDALVFTRLQEFPDYVVDPGQGAAVNVGLEELDLPVLGSWIEAHPEHREAPVCLAAPDHPAAGSYRAAAEQLHCMVSQLRGA